jgi:hypothetical protein
MGKMNDEPKVGASLEVRSTAEIETDNKKSGYDEAINFLVQLSSIFLFLIAILFFLGGCLALSVATGSIIFNFRSMIGAAHLDNYDLTAEYTIVSLIRLAEYLLVGLTFIAISTISGRTAIVAYFNQAKDSDATVKELAVLSNLENYIIGMVIATISVAFIGYIVDPQDTLGTLRVGIGIAVFMIAIGLYRKWSK